MKNYRCITSVQEIQQYISNAAVVAFDYETAPDEPYRIEEKAALDPQKNHMTGCSFSVKEYTGIYVPVAHKVGENIELTSFLQRCHCFAPFKRHWCSISAEILPVSTKAVSCVCRDSITARKNRSWWSASRFTRNEDTHRNSW